jgi:hypothetical protein
VWWVANICIWGLEEPGWSANPIDSSVFTVGNAAIQIGTEPPFAMLDQTPAGGRR